MGRRYSRILVSGGAGFIGSHLVDRLLSEGFNVTVIDNLETGRLDNIAHVRNREQFRFVEGDIRNYDLVRELMKEVDAVFHEAALASVSQSVKDPILTNDVNVKGTLNLLKASLDLGVKRFVYASSASVYGDTPLPLKKENMTLNPKSPYGVSKLAAENYVRVFHQLFDLETVSLRYFNVYGPRQRFDLACAYGGVITIFTNRLLKNMSPIVFGDGEQTRDFIYVEDVVEANMLALDSRKAVGEAFNVGTSERASVNQIAETLKEIMNKKELKNIYAPPRPGDGRGGYADISKAQKIMGFYPKVNMKKGLKELVEWCEQRTSI
jgi:UDP-glucose 4-epimerase